jgi:hypothetical protein
MTLTDQQTSRETFEQQKGEGGPSSGSMHPEDGFLIGQF